MEQFYARLSESVVQVSVEGNYNANERWQSSGTGFVVYSGRLNLVVPRLAQTNFTFIMTAAHLFDGFSGVASASISALNIRSTVKITFLWETEPRSAEILHVDRSYDLAIFYVRDVRIRASLTFNTEVDIPEGTAVHCVSHPVLGEFPQPYLLTSGQSCGICEWSPDERLASDCVCRVFDLCVDQGSSGAPVVDNNGRVLAVLAGASGHDRNFIIGIGVETIITFLLTGFKLPAANVLNLDANQVLAECIENAQNAFLP